jgi:hypothetical protein
MTPKLGQALEAMKKLRTFAEFEGDKLATRITVEAMPLLVETFKGAHVAIDGLQNGVKDISDFCDEVKKVGDNGAPLDTSSEQSGQSVPRSSEVASR